LTLSTTVSTETIAALRDRVAGRVIEPDDADYDAARGVMYGGIDRRPAAVVKVAGVDDIRAVIAAARESGAELAIRSGGPVEGFIGALVFATIGSMVVRLVLRALEGGNPR
jgi:hypothetical protein